MYVAHRQVVTSNVVVSIRIDGKDLLLKTSKTLYHRTCGAQHEK